MIPLLHNVNPVQSDAGGDVQCVAILAAAETDIGGQNGRYESQLFAFWRTDGNAGAFQASLGDVQVAFYVDGQAVRAVFREVVNQ